MVTADSLDRYINTLPPPLRGPNARRVIHNMANGGAWLRSFMRHDKHYGFVTRQLAHVADMLGAKSRTLVTRTALHLLAR